MANNLIERLHRITIIEAKCFNETNTSPECDQIAEPL